mmetsp:Transcript_26432/g.48529  ORF Transcript_26432/g.48529 Transcript_26432/m.48529 type:complete len:90 (-) Transcript_26432:325-594(-)
MYRKNYDRKIYVIEKERANSSNKEKDKNKKRMVHHKLPLFCRSLFIIRHITISFKIMGAFQGLLLLVIILLRLVDHLNVLNTIASLQPS